jgi:hypothetical protein
MKVEDSDIPVMDARQLVRIEAVHRGFLYQHLYAAACLLLAGTAGTIRIVVERDEDVEIVLPDRRIYVQVKTRKGMLAVSDVEDALARFAAIRNEHESGKRSGVARFVIASNAPPSAKLLERLVADAWPSDVELHWPDGPDPDCACLLKPRISVAEALSACNALAANLPFALLRPDTLTWKLAGTVMLAAAGIAPRDDHAFTCEELPVLFEQLIVQMQALPSAPAVYRAQVDEPPLISDDRVRIIAGLSGAGKTAWVAEAAIHSPTPVTYLDVAESPGPALASAVAREVAARMFGRSGGKLGEVLLPGASGLDTLGALSVKLGENGQYAVVVIDNAHRLPTVDMISMIDRAPNLHFLLLCQPGSEVEELEARLGLKAEVLGGWDEDTVAAAVADAGSRADYVDCERLSRLTGALPFFILNAAAVAARQYAGSIAKLCADIEAQTHIVATAQEIILKRAFEGLPAEQQETVAVVSLSDVALSRDEAVDLLRRACEIEEKAAAARLRDLPRTGALELFGNSGLKIHDAMRALGRAELSRRGDAFERKARSALRDVIAASIQRDWSIAKLALLVRLFGQLGETKVLVEFATDELFHEMGVWPEIEPFLIAAAEDAGMDAETRLWALDGLAFNDLREGHPETALSRTDAMHGLLETGDLGPDEWLAWGTKRMLGLSAIQDVDGVLEMLNDIEGRLPDSEAHWRIFRYNRAYALLKLGMFDLAAQESEPLIEEYYDAIGISPADVLARNPPEIRPLLRDGPDLIDDLKHLADTLDLHAGALQRSGRVSPFGRIHAMKFYELAQAPQSFVKVGQDLVDEFVERRDFAGAREVIERNVLPTIQAMGLVSWVVPVRSQYAVVLAYCGEHDAAAAEMARLAPYEEGLDADRRAELRNQRNLVASLRRTGGPPQVRIAIPPALQAAFDRRRQAGSTAEGRNKIGRNEPCPCGSKRKYKHCHGR